MARASRHFIPGYIWHLTHRCHKREFLLKFGRDRSRWMELLFEAKKRFRLSVLNFTVTSNHIHLIVSDNRGDDVIPRAMHLIAGRTGQEYNRRKRRKGAFWEDRYHATAIESGDHLWHCMVYVDLNMVRAGVVDHPSKWKWGGYNEIQNPKERYQVIDHELLRRFLFIETNDELAEIHRRWVESEMKKYSTRQEHFSRALAVGSETFVKKVSDQLGARATEARGRQEEPKGNTPGVDINCGNLFPDTKVTVSARGQRQSPFGR
jgi:putative transposase